MESYVFPSERQSFVESMQAPFAVYQFIDERMVPVALSEGFCALFGHSSLEDAYLNMTRDMYRNVHPDDTARLNNAALHFVRSEADFEVVFRVKPPRDSVYTVIHARGRHVCPESGVRLAEIWYIDEGQYEESVDETNLTHAMSNILHENSILQASRYDYLTGLPNMAYFFEMVEVSRDICIERGQEPVFLYMNMSGMKFFNTKNSFAEGDKLLRAFSRVLIDTFNLENSCHIGADHFAAFTTEDGLEARLESFLQRCREMNDGNNLPVHIGVYSNRMGRVLVSTACDRAKFACDAIKRSYAFEYNYYDEDLRDDVYLRQYILSNLDRAIQERWITVFYQPIVRAVNGRVCDEEALARWIDPERGMLSPASFIPCLEEANQIYKLDLYVLERVLEKMKTMVSNGLYVVPHSINLSRSDFDTCDIVEEVRRRVDDAGISRDRITIEITESTLGTAFEFMKDQVARFQALGFPVWMDDFGSGYSSLDVLQTIKFNLIKFDMSFMRKLDEGTNGKILLTELMRMASALGMDTVCEGVETEAQVGFLQEIGCSKLQGYYFSRPRPLEQILERYRTGTQIGFENPEESAYFETIGRVNLYDLAVLANDGENLFQNVFNSLPMAVMEIRDDKVRFIRSNPSYREFMMNFFDIDVTKTTEYSALPLNAGSEFMKMVRTCCNSGSRSFFDERMPDGSVVHSFARKLSVNPVTGTVAAAIAVLSITDPNEGTTYAQIARALAADYYNIYYVDLDTDQFIEYSSPVGEQVLAMERHGERFFEAVQRDAITRIYEEDRAGFLAGFSKEKIIRDLNEHGVYTAAYRLIDTGAPVYASMKVTRLQAENKIILGVSIVDSQIRRIEHREKRRQEQNTLTRVMALNEDYLWLYTVEATTGRIVDYVVSKEHESFCFGKAGDDFFQLGAEEGGKTVCPEDLPLYLQGFTREKVMEDIEEKGVYKLIYRVMLGNTPKNVTLKIAPLTEGGVMKLFASVRVWRDRR